MPECACYILRMAKDYKCPACKNPVDRDATVCSNPECRKDLAFCSHCRDVATYELVEKKTGRFGRDTYRCTLCQNVGVRCLTWSSGGYCNGLAKTGGKIPHALCANCSGRLSEVGRSVVGWTLIGAIGGLVKRK